VELQLEENQEEGTCVLRRNGVDALKVRRGFIEDNHGARGIFRRHKISKIPRALPALKRSHQDYFVKSPDWMYSQVDIVQLIKSYYHSNDKGLLLFTSLYNNSYCRLLRKEVFEDPFD
jgi:hypothetical protein